LKPRRISNSRNLFYNTVVLGGTLTLFLECEGIEKILAAVENSGAKIVMPLKTQFYGMREFGFQDPEGWIVTMAERVK